MDKPAPVPDQFSAFHWENAARGCLTVRACEECDHVQFPPNAMCENCQLPQLTAEVKARKG